MGKRRIAVGASGLISNPRKDERTARNAYSFFPWPLDPLNPRTLFSLYFVFLEEMGQRFVGLGAHNPLLVEDKGRDRRNAQLKRSVPIGIHRRLVRPHFQNGLNLFFGKTHLQGYRCEFSAFGNVNPIPKIGPKDGVMKFLPPALLLRPLSQFLRQAAVIGSLAVSQRQPFFLRRLAQAGLDLVDTNRPPGKKFLQSQTLLRRFRVKGESPPLNCDFKILSQSFNTPGNEVTPGSDVIGKDFQDRPGFHFFLPNLIRYVPFHSILLPGDFPYEFV